MSTSFNNYPFYHTKSKFEETDLVVEGPALMPVYKLKEDGSLWAEGQMTGRMIPESNWPSQAVHKDEVKRRERSWWDRFVSWVFIGGEWR